MRTYGRVNGTGAWQEVSTSIDAGDSIVWATTLAQVLKLALNESPFYADYGIPAKQSLIQQVAPDFYVMRTQQRFSQYFAALIVARDPAAVDPTYKLDITTKQGVRLNSSIALPQ